jgi:hypothetical protein
MNGPAQIACWTIIIVWLILTPLFNLPSYCKRIRNFDIAGLIPTWTFFAPNPGISDYVVLVRERDVEEIWNPWRVAWRCTPRAWRFLWHPEKRCEKLVTDCSQAIIRDALEGDETLGLGYLLVAKLSREFVDEWSSSGFQFAIISIPGWWGGNRSSELVYLSLPIGVGSAGKLG